MAKSVSYLRHAIAPPKLEPVQAPRPRLTHLLNASIDKRLILIAAPAGFGKTTLLAEFGAQADRPVCWARLVEADQDVMRLAGLVWATLEKRFRRLRGRVQVDRLVGASPRALARAITGGVTEAIDEPFALALDDVHWLNASGEGREFLGALVESAPPGMSVIAAGREVPDIPLVKLLAADQLVTLDGDSLALRADELADVVNRRTGESLTEADVAGLMEETGGWVTGVLLSESLVGKRLPGLQSNGQPLSYEYLASVVFDRQPEPIQRFLMDSSVLPVMTAELCDTVLERTDSQAMLDAVLRRGLFITVTEDRPRTYEYHQLFREYMQLRADRLDGGRHRQLLCAAGKALAAIDEWAEAGIDLLLQADLVELAADTASGLRRGILRRGKYGTLRRWVETFIDRGLEVPFIELALASGLETAAHRSEAAMIYARVWRRLNELDPQDSHELRRICLKGRGHMCINTEDWAGLRNAINGLRTLMTFDDSPNDRLGLARLEALYMAIYEGDWKAAAKEIEHAINDYSGRSDPFEVGLAWITRTYLESYSGHLSAAAHSADVALSAARSKQVGYSEPNARMNSSFIALMQGDFETAFREIRSALTAALSFDAKEDEGAIRTTEAEILIDLGVWEQAMICCDKAKDAYQGSDIGPLWSRYLLATEACLFRRSGMLRLAEQTLGQAGMFPNFDRDSRVQTELAGLESRIRPQAVVSTVRKSRLSAPLTAQDKGLSLFFLARGHFALRNESKARYWLAWVLRAADKYGAIQAISAELSSDGEFYEFADQNFSGSADWLVIQERIGRIRKFAQSMTLQTPRSSTTTTGLRIVALGSPRVWMNGKICGRLSAADVGVLVFLADGGTGRGERLADAFWPDSPPESQRANLHTCIYRLRQALGSDSLEYKAGSYLLKDGVLASFDVTEFEQAVALGRKTAPTSPEGPSVLTETLKLYTGSFMDGMDGQWITERRAALESEFISGAAKAAKELGPGRTLEALIPELRRALKVDPYDEELNHYYLQALASLGRTTELKRHYREYARALRRDLRVDVPPMTRDTFGSRGRTSAHSRSRPSESPSWNS